LNPSIGHPFAFDLPAGCHQQNFISPLVASIAELRGTSEDIARVGTIEDIVGTANYAKWQQQANRNVLRVGGKTQGKLPKLKTFKIKFFVGGKFLSFKDTFITIHFRKNLNYPKLFYLYSF